MHRGGSGEPLVLVHGIGHTWRGLKPMLPAARAALRRARGGPARLRPLPPLPDGDRARPPRRWPTRSRARWTRPASRRRTWPATRSAAGSPSSWRAAAAPAPSRRSRRPASRTPRERPGARTSCSAMRWLARNAPRPRAAAAQPAYPHALRGPTRSASPGGPIPDELIEQTELFADAPGFDATLAARRAPAARPGLATSPARCWCSGAPRDVILLPRQGRRFERLIPDCRAALPQGPRPRADVRRPGAAGRGDREFALRTLRRARSPERRAAAPA